MKTITGILQFHGLEHPIILIGESGVEINISPYITNVFSTLNNQRVTETEERTSYGISSDPESDYTLEILSEHNIWINRADQSHTKNVSADLEYCFQRLNGQLVDCSFETGAHAIVGLQIQRSTVAPVTPSVYYTDANYCTVSRDHAQTVCQLGGEAPCVFLTVGSDGYSCVKFCSVTSRQILDRVARNDFRATRIGDCHLAGRKETAEA